MVRTAIFKIVDTGSFPVPGTSKFSNYLYFFIFITNSWRAELCPCGGIGRHSGFPNHLLPRNAGSSPATGVPFSLSTIHFFDLSISSIVYTESEGLQVLSKLYTRLEIPRKVDNLRRAPAFRPGVCDPLGRMG